MSDDTIAAVRVPLNGKHSNGSYALVDAKFAEQVIARRWVRTEHGYASATYPRPVLYLHRLIARLANFPPSATVDHINSDRLDCREENLRPASSAENARNQPKSRGATSRFKGVFRHSKNPYWTVTISNYYKHQYLGSFDSEEDGARAYDAAAVRIYGEFARLNFPEDRSRYADPGFLAELHSRSIGALRRATAAEDRASRKCGRGHVIAENAYVKPNGKRTCRICRIEKQRERRDDARSVRGEGSRAFAPKEVANG